MADPARETFAGPDDTRRHLSRSRLWLAILAILAAEVLGTLESSMIYTALPAIARDFGGLGRTSQLLTAYLLVQAVAAAIGGRLGDMYGRRRILLIVLGCCGAGSALSAFHPAFEWIVIGRILQGASGAILPLGFGIVREIVPEKDTPFFVGVVTGAYAASGALGFVLGGLLVDYGGWRLIFWFTAGLAPFVVAAARLAIPKSPPAGAHQRIDYIGALLFLLGVGGLLQGIANIPAHGLLALSTSGLFVACGGILILWTWYEMRHPSPLIDVRLLQNRQIIIANLSFVLLGLGPLQMPFVLLAFAQQPLWTGAGLGVSATVAALLKLPSNIVAGAAAPVSGLIAERIGSRGAMQIGGLLSVFGWGILIFLHHSLPLLILAFIAIASSLAFIMTATPTLIMEIVPRARTAEATGLSYVFRAVGLAAGAQVATALLALETVSNSAGARYPTEGAYVGTFAFITVVSATLTMLIFFLPGRQRARSAAEAPDTIGRTEW